MNINEKEIMPLGDGENPPAEIPQTTYINVNGRKEHEDILRDEKKMIDIGLDPHFERMVYLKRWGGFLYQGDENEKLNSMNFFKKILKELPESKIEVVPEDPKDQEVAKQMTQLIRHQSMSFKFRNKVSCGKKWDENE